PTSWSRSGRLKAIRVASPHARSTHRHIAVAYAITSAADMVSTGTYIRLSPWLPIAKLARLASNVDMGCRDGRMIPLFNLTTSDGWLAFLLVVPSVRFGTTSR